MPAQDISFADADPDLNDPIDAVYRTRYRRYGPSIIGGVVNPGAQMRDRRRSRE